MAELADFMMRDPFTRPVAVELHDHVAALSAALSLLGLDGTDRDVLLMTPASAPKSVIDARADWTCAACALPVWVSPSSRQVANPLVVCLACLTRGLRGGT